MSDLTNGRIQGDITRFASIAASGALRLEAARGMDGRPSPLEVAQGAKGSAKPQWKRKSLKWALGAVSIAALSWLGSVSDSAPGMQIPSKSPLAESAVDRSIEAAQTYIGGVRGASVIAQARADWEWASDQGYFVSKHKPRIGNFDSEAGFDDQAGEPHAIFEYEDAKAPGAEASKAVDIQISKSAIGSRLQLMSEQAAEDINYIVLHEAYHADAYLASDTTVFGGSLAQGASGEVWRAGLWAAMMTRHQGTRGFDPQQKAIATEVQRRSGALCSTYEESGADAFSMIAQARQVDKYEWNKRLVHIEGRRIEDMMLAGLVGRDGHETQEALQILAALGHDKIAALPPEKGRRLAEAIASDATMLAAGKQGLAFDLYFAAQPVREIMGWEKTTKGFRDAEGLIATGLKADAEKWANRSDEEQKDINAQWLRDSHAWEKGARLDYSFIEPGLVAQLRPHAPNSNYEVPSGAGRSSDPVNAQKRDWRQHPSAANQLQGARALQEWREVAEMAGEQDALNITSTRSAKRISPLLDEKTKEKMMGDNFWAPSLGSIVRRLAQRRTEEIARQGGAQNADSPAQKAPRI